MTTFGKLTSILALAASATLGAYLLFGPTGMSCMFATTVAAGQLSGNVGTASSCAAVNLLTALGGALLPALVVFAAWSFAPALAVIGTWRVRQQPLRIALIVIAILIELTSAIGVGASGLLVVMVGPILVLTLMAAGLARSPRPA